MFLVISTLKKLELFLTDKNGFSIMTPEKQLDLLIKYYVINEFSKSPYNFLLYKLNRENFNLKYKKTEKYMSKDNLEEFIGYFITCLQEELID